MTTLKISVVCAVCVAVLISGCGKTLTAIQLATALKEKGIDYTEVEAIDTTQFKHAKINEGITLKGDGLRVEIYRISGKKDYDLFKGASTLMLVHKHETQKDLRGLPGQTYFKRPFAVIVRQEPKGGEVVKALNGIFSKK